MDVCVLYSDSKINASGSKAIIYYTRLWYYIAHTTNFSNRHTIESFETLVAFIPRSSSISISDKTVPMLLPVRIWKSEGVLGETYSEGAEVASSSSMV